MKTIKNLLLICALCAGVHSFAYSGSGDGADKKALTHEQILRGLPEGILNTIPTFSGWNGNDEIVLSERVVDPRNKRTTLVRSSYNIKTGAKKPLNEESANKLDKNTQMRDSLYMVVTNALDKEKVGNCKNFSFSPDFSKVAYTFENDLYVYSFLLNKEIRLTTREHNHILNGYASWVYYEEILGRGSRYKAFWWSPNSNQIAYYQFDETNVPMFPIYDSRGQYGSITETYYPKAGCNNPTVKVFVANLNGFDTPQGGNITYSAADFDWKEDQYFGIPFWNAEGDKFIVPWMPREQDHLVLYSLDTNGDGILKKNPIYDEKQKTWIDWMEDMHFTPKGFYMVRDFDMWEQIYYQSFDGKTFKKITEGKNWGVQILTIDEKKGEIIFTARREISTRVDVYKVSLKTGRITRLSEGEYNYAGVRVSPDNKHFVAMRSNVTTPSQMVLGTTDGKGALKVLYDSKGEKFDEYKLALPEMLFIEVDGFRLPARVIWPVNLDSTKKYPVLVSMYGGPNSGTVMDTWAGLGERTQWWANEGVIQISIDHRGSGHCGKEGLNFLHRNLLTVELSDYIEWVKELWKRPFVNRDKVGITGFSYGGSMTMLAVTAGSDYFKYGIAGGGVYDYALYDSHYTERYMDTPQTNPEGYKNTRIMDKVAHYKGDSTNYVKITHGTADDNVHMQNTLQLINALQDAGKQFDLMIYPGEYHGYRGRKSVHSGNNDYIFWYRHLLGKDAPAMLMR